MQSVTDASPWQSRYQRLTLFLGIALVTTIQHDIALVRVIKWLTISLAVIE
jgi:hypothetical protein